MFFYCYNEKDLKNGWLWEKNFKPPSFVVGTSLLLELFVLAHCAPPKRYILWKDRVAEGGERESTRVDLLYDKEGAGRWLGG